MTLSHKIHLKSTGKWSWHLPVLRKAYLSSIEAFGASSLRDLLTTRNNLILGQIRTAKCSHRMDGVSAGAGLIRHRIDFLHRLILTKICLRVIMQCLLLTECSCNRFFRIIDGLVAIFVQNVSTIVHIETIFWNYLLNIDLQLNILNNFIF